MVVLVIKFWDNIWDLIDDIIFEIQYATGHYKNPTKNTGSKRNSYQKDINELFKNNVEVTKTDTKTKSQPSSEQKVEASMTQAKTTNVQKTYQAKDQFISKDLTFSFIPGLYTDYTARKEKLSLEWVQNIYSITLEDEHRDLMGYYGPYWYPSAYRCDYCQDELYKTVYPVGKEFQIKTTEEGIWHIKRAFTCPTCEKIYAPMPGYRYTESYATYQAKNEPDYREKVTMMGVYGTTEGRQDI